MWLTLKFRYQEMQIKSMIYLPVDIHQTERVKKKEEKMRGRSARVSDRRGRRERERRKRREGKGKEEKEEGRGDRSRRRREKTEKTVLF